MDSLRGQLLLASPALDDPNFQRTVVLIGEHSEGGALGVVLNRPSPVSVAEAVPRLGEAVEDAATVFVGGPVEPTAVIVLAEFVDPDLAALIVFGRIGFPAAQAEMEELAGATERGRVFAGHAGWGPGQLDAELERGDWISALPRPEDVFTEEPEALWSRVLTRKGGRFALLASMPPDPSVN